MDAVDRSRGFTLIEVLVVIAIIGITIALITPKLSATPDQALKQEVERISALISAAQDEAVTRSQVLAWSVEDGQLRFWERAAETREWRAITDPDFRPRALQSELTALRIGNARAATASKILLTPDGVQPAYEARFELSGLQANLSSDALGQIRHGTP